MNLSILNYIIEISYHFEKSGGMMENPKETLTDEFRNDLLFIYIQQEGLEHELFDDNIFYQKIRKNVSYSTKEAASLLGLGNKDWTIRNYLNRYNLDEYVQIGKVGNQMMLDYDSVFKFKMIFLLRDLKNKKPVDIAGIVGTTPTEFEPTTHKANPFRNSTDLSNDVNNHSTVELLLLSNLSQQRQQIEKNIQEIHQKRDTWYKEISDVTDKITLIEHMKYQEDYFKKNQKFLIDALEEQSKKGGVFSFLKKNRSTVFSSLKENMEQEQNTDTQNDTEDNYKKLIQRRDKLEKEKDELFQNSEKRLAEYRRKMDKIDGKVNDIYSKLDSNDPVMETLSSIQYIEVDND